MKLQASFRGATLVRTMKVILLENIKKVGQKGDVVAVSDGHALNFLIPNNKAVFASKEAMLRVTQQNVQQAHEATAALADLETGIGELDGKTVILTVPANEQGHLFAAVHEQDVANAIKDQLGISLPLEALALPGEIKATGKCDVAVSAGKAKSKLTLSVEAQSK